MNACLCVGHKVSYAKTLKSSSCRVRGRLTRPRPKEPRIRCDLDSPRERDLFRGHEPGTPSIKWTYPVLATAVAYDRMKPTPRNNDCPAYAAAECIRRYEGWQDV